MFIMLLKFVIEMLKIVGQVDQSALENGSSPKA